jgi:hypothetical protein
MRASFELERFERVVAVPGIALLRVSGRFRAEAVARLEPPVLLVDGGGGPRRIQALPGAAGVTPMAGPGGGVPWRGGFPVPAHAVKADAAFALEAGAAGTIELPRPVDGPADARRA